MCIRDSASTDKNPAIKTDLFYCTPDRKKSDYPTQLEQLCQAAGVNLHRRLTDRDGPLSAQEVAACLQPRSSVWSVSYTHLDVYKRQTPA